MPITLGILAQARQAPVAAGSYDLLETYSVGSGGIANVTFDVSSYASTYTHLQIRATSKVTGGSDQNIRVQLNADTGTNYRLHYLYGNGSSVLSSYDDPTAYMFMGNSSGSNFSGAVIDFLDAYKTTKNTTVRALNATSNTTIWLASGLWVNTNAISSIKLFPGGGQSWAEFSRFSIYGIKG